MLFWIFVAIMIIGIICLAAYNNTSVGQWCDILGTVLTLIAGAVVLISLIIFGIRYIGADGYVAENQIRYESLVYQYENDLYDNDNDLGKKELMNEIRKWNEDLARYKTNQHDFWLGIYIPNVFNQFNFVELKPIDN